MKIEQPIRIIPDKKHKNMWRLQWKNGDISVCSIDPKPWEKGGHYGFYNKTRANDILNNYADYLDRMRKSESMQGNQYKKNGVYSDSKPH